MTLRHAHLILASTAALLHSCGPPEVATGPDAGFENLLLLTFDTTRADRIGCYGYERASTPTLDRLAREGVLFEQTFSAAPTTLPSHASILTGLHPFTHGARNNGTHHLPREVRTLAEHLSAAGFETGAVVSSFVLDSRFGLDQGFDAYDDDLSKGAGGGGFGFRETRAEDVVARARNWLARRGDGRWFLWLHFFDPHSNYDAPEPHRSRFADSPYDGEIAYVDAMLGELLDELRRDGELDDTLVAMTADHGESLGEHGEATHGVFVYDATTRVPFILSHPALRQGERVPDVAQGVDLAPTVLELLDTGAGAQFDGRSWAAVALGQGEGLEARDAYSESLLPRINYGWAELRSLRDRDHRYVRAPRPELYSDSGETHDLSAAEPERMAGFSARLDALLPAREADARTSDIAKLDPQVRSSLADLGYTFDESAEELDGERADPKDRIGHIARQLAIEELVARGEPAAAELAYRELVAENPSSVPLRDAYARVLLDGGNQREALEVHRGSRELPGVRAVNFLIVAELERALGIEGWERSLELAKSIDPGDPLPWVREADLVHMPADPEAARRAYERALALDERCVEAWVGICKVEAAYRRVPQALDAARKATAIDPAFFDGWFMLGTVSAAAGKPKDALIALRRARDLDPAHLQVRLGLSMLLASSGDASGAETELRAALEIDRGAVEALAARKPVVAATLERIR